MILDKLPKPIQKFIGYVPVPKMFYRLESLMKYAKAVPFEDERLTTLEIDMQGNSNHISFQFKSDLGTVQLYLEKYDGLQGTAYELEYITYAGANLFKMHASRKNLTVVPNLGYNLKANDIDLAILEIETYLAETYGNVDEVYTNYQHTIKEENNKHLKEIEKLK